MIPGNATLRQIREIVASASAASRQISAGVPEPGSPAAQEPGVIIPIVEVLFEPKQTYRFDLRAPFPDGCGWTGSPPLQHIAGGGKDLINESLEADKDPPHCYLFNLTGASGLRIQGSGATFTFTHGFISFVGTYRSTRVHVANMSVDFDPLPNSALLPLGSARGGKGPPYIRSFLASLAPGHPPLDDPTVGSRLVSYGIAGIQARLGTGVPAGRVQRGAREVVPYVVNPPVDGQGLAWGTTADGAPVYNLTIDSSDPAIAVDPRSAVVIDPRIATGFDIYRSDTVVLSDIDVFACSNECANSAYTPRVTMLRLQILLKQGRYYAANNGGHNHHNARIGAWWECGTTEATGDDGSNFNCLESLPDDSQPDSPADTLHLKPGPYDPVGNLDGDIDYRPGDWIQVYNRTAGAIVVEANVVEVFRRPGAGPPTHGVGGALGAIRREQDRLWRLGKSKTSLDMNRVNLSGQGSTVGGPVTVVRLDRNISVPIVGPSAGDVQVFNWNRTATQLAVRNLVLNNTRRVGVLSHGQRILVQNVTFQGLGGGALEGWPDPAEGPGVRTAVMEGCSITDVQQLNRVAAPVWFASFARNNFLVHGDIVVRNNAFDTGPGSNLLLWNVDGGLVSNNTATRCVQSKDSSPWVGVENDHGTVRWVGQGNSVSSDSMATRLCVKQQS